MLVGRLVHLLHLSSCSPDGSNDIISCVVIKLRDDTGLSRLFADEEFSGFYPDDPKPLHDAELTPAEREQLSDPELQERYRKEALKQLRRLQCPGCGESELF